MRAERISLQLYTVRELAANDPVETLRAVAGMGYPAVEFAGYYGHAPRELRFILDACGLAASGSHVRFAEWREDPETVVSGLRALDCTHAIVPIVPERHRQSAASVARLAETFNGWGELCRSHGLTFSYHNHDFEFAPLDDGADSMWDVLVRETDPDLVHLQLDLYWARYAGVDPEKLLWDLAGRVSIVHLKDMASDPDRSDAPVGEGTMPWPELIASCEVAGAQWYVVEQDHPKDALEDVRRSLENLLKLADGGG